MKRRTLSRVVSVIACISLVALLAGLLPAPAAAAVPTRHVTVYLKNYHEEYNYATAQFLFEQFDYPDSPAYGLVSYTVTTALTPAALAGSAALVIDESADMSLTAEEAAIIHDFAARGGRVGLFTFPRYYWDHEGSNPAAFQAVADLFGNAVIGTPSTMELESGDSSAGVVPAASISGLSLSQPYNITGALVENYDQTPFTPITSSDTVPVLISQAFDGAPVAVATRQGLLVTNPIGDMVQGADANATYKQFVVDAIVWLASAPRWPLQAYLPLIVR